MNQQGADQHEVRGIWHSYLRICSAFQVIAGMGDFAMRLEVNRNLKYDNLKPSLLRLPSIVSDAKAQLR